jgi:hypothetical protein
MLMILITLSLAAILVAWAGNSYGAFTGGSQVFFQQRGQALQERLVIEEVFFIKSSTTIQLFVRNVGVLDIKLVAVYVNGTSYSPATGSTCSFSTSLPVQQACQLNVNWGSSWNSGSTFLIVVATARGNQAIYTARGP